MFNLPHSTEEKVLDDWGTREFRIQKDAAVVASEYKMQSKTWPMYSLEEIF